MPRAFRFVFVALLAVLALRAPPALADIVMPEPAPPVEPAPAPSPAPAPAPSPAPAPAPAPEAPAAAAPESSWGCAQAIGPTSALSLLLGGLLVVGLRRRG